MENYIYSILSELAENKIVQLVIVAIVADTIFGVIRSLKEHKFNSCIGIDGAIRKISMLVGLVILGITDMLMSINLVGFIPDDILKILPVKTIGLTSFFGLLFLSYETVSILKNMTLCGLPVKGIWIRVRKILSKYTKELPDTEEKEEVNDEDLH